MASSELCCSTVPPLAGLEAVFDDPSGVVSLGLRFVTLDLFTSPFLVLLEGSRTLLLVISGFRDGSEPWDPEIAALMALIIAIFLLAERGDAIISEEFVLADMNCVLTSSAPSS